MGEIDIKLIWKSGEDKEPASYPQEAIDALVSKKPRGVVERFVKTLKIELIINIISLLVVAFAMAWNDRWWLAFSLTLFNGIQYAYYRSLIKKLNVDFIDANVVSYLQDMQALINRFINHYRVFIIILMIPAFWLVKLLLEENDGFQRELTTSQVYLSCGVLVSFLVVISFFVLHLMYGKKSARIKEMIDSLRQEEG